MSEGNHFSIADVPEPIAEAIADTFNDLSTPARQNVGNFLGDLSYCIFGKLHTYVAKRKFTDSLEIEFHESTTRFQQEQKLKSYLSSISDIIESTPNDKLCEPRLDIIGPAMEASKYYINNEEIRNMFVQLIGASINTDTTDDVHHSYVEIIKNLSPLDASNLKVLSTKSSLPICEYHVELESGYRLLRTHVWGYFEKDQSISRNSVSMSNLSRLGLVKIDYTTYKVNFDYDKAYMEQPFYTYYQNCLDSLNKGLPIEDPPYDIELLKDGKSITLSKGVVELTPLGKSFTEICCS